MKEYLDLFHDKMVEERLYQVDKWGDKIDKNNTANDWVAFIAQYLGKAVTLPWNKDTFQTMLVKVATLCAAAYEWSERGMAKRHYD
jgi:hypothetical protein